MPDILDELKIMIREAAVPYFEDAELEYYLNKNNGDVKKAAYECLIIKAEDTTLSISGLTTNDTSKYFLRLAARYKPNNSGVLRRG